MDFKKIDWSPEYPIKGSSYMDHIRDIIYADLANNFDHVVESALAIKGFVFDNRKDLEDFIKKNCHAASDGRIDSPITYSVKGEPFLIEDRCGGDVEIDHKGKVLSATVGTFYLPDSADNPEKK